MLSSIITSLTFLLLSGTQLSTTGCNTKQIAVPGDTAVKKTSDSTVKKTIKDTAKISDTLVWYDFEAGYLKAQKEGKILLVDAYTDWCGWCKVMDRETYSQKSIIRTLNKDYVAVKFNPEKAKTYQFGSYKMSAEELLYWLGSGRAYGYPSTFFWLNPGTATGTEQISISIGYEDPAKFTQTLNTVKAKKRS